MRFIFSGERIHQRRPLFETRGALESESSQLPPGHEHELSGTVAHAAMQGHLEDYVVWVDGVGGEEVVFGGVADQFRNADGHLSGLEVIQVLDAADYTPRNWNKKSNDK